MRPQEESRLEATLGINREVNYEGTSYTYRPDFQWGTGDFEDVYPVLVFEYDQEAEQRDDDQPMNDLLEIDERANDVPVDIHEVARVRDIIQITLAADVGRDDNGVPWHIMVQQTMMSVWEQLRFTADLNNVGSNGERPMKLRVSGPPSGPVEENGIIRSRLSMAADYNYVHTRTVDAIAEAETETNVD